MTSHELFALADIAPDSVRRAEVAGRAVAVARIGDDVYAIGDTCSHADVSLSEGWVDAQECAVECSAHGAMFSLETGAALSLPATRPVAAYQASVVDGMVVVTVDAPGGR